MTGFEQALEIIKEYHPYAWTWDDQVLWNWAAFYAENGLMIAVSQNNKDIHGLVMWRLVMKPEDGCGNTMTHDPEGNCCFLDFTYGPSSEIRRGLICAVIKQIGRRETVAWERHGTLRIYKGWTFVRRNLKGEKHYGRSIAS